MAWPETPGGHGLDRDNYRILHQVWKVRELASGDPRINDSYGKADFNNWTIWICSDLPNREKIETLIHETIHIISDGLSQLDLTREDSVRQFSSILVDTLERNGVLNLGSP